MHLGGRNTYDLSRYLPQNRRVKRPLQSCTTYQSMAATHSFDNMIRKKKRVKVRERVAVRFRV